MVDVPELDILLPHAAEPIRTDGLWQTTCFEAFLKVEGQDAYSEHNFSPSGQWAAYAFDGYRTEMRALSLRNTPEIWLDAGSSWIGIEAEAEIQSGNAHNPLQIALSAVIEETDGTKSYWALRHPPGLPDFHHPHCFAVVLEAAEPA